MSYFPLSCHYIFAWPTLWCHVVVYSFLRTSITSERLDHQSQCCQALPFKLRIVEPPFADFSMILRILSPIFSQQKKRKKNDETYARKRCRHNPAFSLHKKVGHTGTTVLPDKIVLRSHARPKDDVEVRKGKLCWQIQSISLFHRSSLCWKDCRLRVQQNTSLTHSQQRRQVRSILVGFGLQVTGNVNKASVVDAEIRAAQSERERNATREPIL